MLRNRTSTSIQYGVSTQTVGPLSAGTAPNVPRPHGREPVGFALGPFVLVPQRHLLLHDGAPVTVGSRAFAILHELVRWAGDLVSKDSLLDLAWPSTFVDAANLRVQIAGIRRALNAHGDSAGFIVNVPGRGYKFVESVTLLQRGEMDGQERFPASWLRDADGARASEVAPVIQPGSRWSSTVTHSDGRGCHGIHAAGTLG